MLNQRGFSMIEAVVTMSIMLVAISAIGQVFVSQKQSVMFLEDKIEAIQLNNLLELSFLNETLCTQNLQGKRVPASNEYSTDVSQVNNAMGSVLVTSESAHGNLQVGQIGITNNSSLTAGSVGIVDLVVPIRRIRKGGGPQGLNPVVVQTLVQVDGSRNITSCINSSTGVPDPTVTPTGTGGEGPQPCNSDPKGAAGNYPHESLWSGYLHFDSSYQYSGIPVFRCLNGSWMYVSTKSPGK